MSTEGNRVSRLDPQCSPFFIQVFPELYYCQVFLNSCSIAWIGSLAFLVGLDIVGIEKCCFYWTEDPCLGVWSILHYFGTKILGLKKFVFWERRNCQPAHSPSHFHCMTFASPWISSYSVWGLLFSFCIEMSTVRSLFEFQTICLLLAYKIKYPENFFFCAETTSAPPSIVSTDSMTNVRCPLIFYFCCILKSWLNVETMLTWLLWSLEFWEWNFGCI